MQDIASQDELAELPDLGDSEELGGLADLGGAEELGGSEELGGLDDLGGPAELGSLDDLSAGEPQVELEQMEEPGNLDRAIEELESLAPEAVAQTTARRDPEPTQNTQPSDVIWDIPIEVSIIIGSAELSVAELMALEGGEIISLDRQIGEPVDVVVNGRKIATGEITVMEDDNSRFGIKIVEIVGR